MSKRPRVPKPPEAYIAFADDPKMRDPQGRPGFVFKATFKGGFKKDSSAHHHCRLLLDYLHKICQVSGEIKEENHMEDGTIVTPPESLIVLPPGVQMPERPTTN